MVKYLIIGSNGTLGSEFKTLLPQAETMAVDRTGLDITNPQQVESFFSNHTPQIVVNCAAYTNVDGAETDYDTALQLNSEVLKVLSQACNQVGAKLIHFSTGMVFSGTDPLGYNEDSITSPVNKYGESKLAGEKNIQDNCQDFYIIRSEWLYGKPQSQDAKKSFVELMIELGKSGKVKGVSDEIGKPTWVKDLTTSTLNLIESAQPSGIYHLTNEGQASRLEWAQEIYKILNMKVQTEAVSGDDFPRPAKRPRYELINNTKLPKLRSWQEALTEYLTK